MSEGRFVQRAVRDHHGLWRPLPLVIGSSEGTVQEREAPTASAVYQYVP